MNKVDRYITHSQSDLPVNDNEERAKRGRNIKLTVKKKFAESH